MPGSVVWVTCPVCQKPKKASRQTLLMRDHNRWNDALQKMIPCLGIGMKGLPRAGVGG
jgi:hypothetical protein